jgi:hypothetical protein
VEAEEAEIRSRGLDLEERLAASRLVPGVLERPPGHRGDRRARSCDPVGKIEHGRQPLDDPGVGRLLEDDEIRRQGAEHLAQDGLPAGASEADVVADDSQRRALR